MQKHRNLLQSTRTMQSHPRECLVLVAAAVLGTPTSACCSRPTSEIHESNALKGGGRRIELLAGDSRRRWRPDVAGTSDLSMLVTCYVVL